MSKRRRSTSDFRAPVVVEGLTGAKNIAESYWEHRLGPQLLSHWGRSSRDALLRASSGRKIAVNDNNT
jgi:hypothetical protein